MQNDTVASQPLRVTLVVATAFFMEMFDSTVIVTALPTMARDFHTSVVSLSLGLTAYMLSTAVLLPASGWIADRFGPRRVFCSATLVFILSSVWCGLSQTMTSFIVARSVQGIGAALMSPVGRLLVLRATPKDQLVRIMNLMTIPALTGPVLGPPIGGLITTFASWRWCFFINVPIGLGILYFMLTRTHSDSERITKPFDRTGFILNGLSFASLIYGLEELADHWPGNMRCYALLAFGAVMGWLAIRHARRADHPIVDLHPLSVRSFRVCTLGGGGLFRLTIMAPVFLLPLMFQVGMGMTAFQSGLTVLAHPAGDLLAKSITSQSIHRLGFRRILLLTGGTFAVCVCLFALFTPQTPTLWIVMLLFVSGVLRSLQMGGLSSLQFADIPPEHMTHASTLSGISMQVQRAFGIAFAAILLNVAASLHASGTQGLVLADFHISFVLMSVVCICSLFWYWPLPKEVGARLLTAGKENP